MISHPLRHCAADRTGVEEAWSDRVTYAVVPPGTEDGTARTTRRGPGHRHADVRDDGRVAHGVLVGRPDPRDAPAPLDDSSPPLAASEAGPARWPGSDASRSGEHENDQPRGRSSPPEALAS